ncbi:MAG TPA: hypothetical protein VF916_08315 [Ktedonobacterales bacterium]
MRTPKGNGIVVQRWPDLVGVKLDETQEIAYFRGEDEIALVQPEHREIAEPAAPKASPPGQSHLERLRGAARVSTPKGNGRLWYNEPLRVGVNLDGTHHCTWFRDPDDLARILPEPKPQEELP